MMTQTWTRALVAIVLAGVLSGCSSKYYYRYSPPIKHTTNVVYRENDFKFLKSHLVGSASCGYFLGFATGDPRVESRALKELYQSAEGAQLGGASQLVNWTSDETTTNFFFIYQKERVVLSADLIEFVK